MSDCSIPLVQMKQGSGIRRGRIRFQWLGIAIAAITCWMGGPPLPAAHAQAGINITKEDAMKSDSADQWLTDTMKGIREKVRRKNGAPNELAGAFIGEPFSTALDNLPKERSDMSSGCGYAAAKVASGVVSTFEEFGTGAIGAAINTVKGAVDLGKSIYDTGKSVATAGGSTIVEKAGEAAVDAVKDAATDAAKDIGKDVAKGTASDVAKGNKPDVPGKIGEAVQKKLDDAQEFVDSIKDYFKDGPIIFAYSGSKNGCNVVTLWIWDEKEINLYIRGTCDCKAADAFVPPKGEKPELSSFFFHLKAATVRTGSSGILKFTLGTVYLVDKAFQCGCPKPKTATGYQPAVPAVCPKCVRLAKQISDLEKDIANSEQQERLINVALREARRADDGTDAATAKIDAERSRLDKAKADTERLKAELEKAKKEKDECERKPCDDQGSYIYPRTSREQYVSYTTDNTAYCTYTEATVTTEYVTWIDPRTYTPGPTDIPKTPGGPQSTPRPEPSDVPKSPETPKASTPGPSTEKTPTAPKPSPTPVASTPSPTPATTTDTTPPAGSDTPSDIPDNVEVKATEAVLEGGPTGTPLEGQTIKLTLTDKPDLPGTGDKAAQDTGYDKPPAQCTTDAKGECTIKIEADERPQYNLPQATKAHPGNYRLELARPRTSGGVAETTGRKTPVDVKLLESVGSKITATSFSIGNRTFERFALEDKYGADNRVADKLKEAFGPDYEEDLCEDKEPGPFTETERPAAAELPGTTVKLGREPAVKGGVR
ncbi:MAG TPA: hypothetical protein VFB02_16760 [Bradyrhizobium sp.]|nr:hypothetical protein [Bradyrhizobium sp.]